MLARLDEQQELVIHRVSQELPASVDAVQAQSAIIEATRRQREQTQRQTAVALGLPAESTLGQISQSAPANYRPLVEALVQENNELLFRVQQRARQNHLLLSRSLELMKNLVESLLPGNPNPTYNEEGQRLGQALRARSFYEAVC
jgi:hypothetical protein